jgi:hypothetical protein
MFIPFVWTTGSHQEDLPARNWKFHQWDGSLPHVKNAPTLSLHQSNLVSIFHVPLLILFIGSIG